MNPSYLATFTVLLVALIFVEQTAPRLEAPRWRRLLWLSGELALCFFIVRVHGTLVRPALIYLLPIGQALIMFGPRNGLAVSASAWLVYGTNVGMYAWPNKLHEFPNYLSCIEAGASGYLLKDIGSDALAEAVRAAARGESPMQPYIARKVLKKLRSGASSSFPASPSPATLSWRQLFHCAGNGRAALTRIGRNKSRDCGTAVSHGGNSQELHLRYSGEDRNVRPHSGRLVRCSSRSAMSATDSVPHRHAGLRKSREPVLRRAYGRANAGIARLNPS